MLSLQTVARSEAGRHMLSLLKLALVMFAFVAVLFGSLVVSLSHRIIEDGRHRQIIKQQIRDSHDAKNWRLK